MTDSERGSAERPARRLPIEAIIGAGVAVILATAVAAAASPAPAASTTPGSPGGFETIDELGRGGHPGHIGFGGFGGITITAINGNEVGLATVDGWTRTISVTDDTEISREGEDATVADLEVGDAVRFRQSRNDDGTFSIEALAVVLPRIAGEVTAIDGSTITVETPDGAAGTIRVSDDTEIRVDGDDDAAISDIEVGDVVIAAGERSDDGSIDATRVVAGERLRGWHGPGLGGDSFDDAPTEDGDAEDGDGDDSSEG